MPNPALILFDVDATLISTSRSGIRAMRLAANDLFGPVVDIDHVEFAGKLDPLIIADILSLGGLDATTAEIASFHARYRAHLAAILKDPSTQAIALPGVLDLLNALQTHPHITTALLTGNYPDTGTLKLHACGIDPSRFTIAVWADASTSTPPTRDDLPGVGLAKWRKHAGTHAQARHAVVIGDTPHDIRCAKVHGCRCIAVATGPYEIDQLTPYSPDLAVEDLSDTAAVLQAIQTWTGPH
ncbi:MAG: HAD family hydrolase [bacterium]